MAAARWPAAAMAVLRAGALGALADIRGVAGVGMMPWLVLR